MTLKRFTQLAEKIGTDRLCYVSINGEIAQAKLQFQNGYFYICQNIQEGMSCSNRLGYRFSYIVSCEDDAKHVESLKLRIKTNNRFLYGVEIECFFDQSKEDEVEEEVEKLGFDFGNDSSIHPDLRTQTRAEIRTQGGSTLEELEVLLKGFEKIARKYKIKVNSTCGLHVHVSNDMFLVNTTLEKVIKTWISVEDVLFATQPQSRLKSRYCIRKLKDFTVKGIPYLPKNKESLKSVLDNDRYQSLNLASLSQHGTIECRLHAGTTNIIKIINWIKLLTKVYEYSFYNYKAKEMKQIFNTPIDNKKIKKVWDLLKLEKEVQTFYNRRICKFTFTQLNSQLELVQNVFKLNPQKKLLIKKLKDHELRVKEIEKESDKIREQHQKSQDSLDRFESKVVKMLGKFGVEN